MASKLALPSNLRAQVMRILRPVTKWGRATVWLAILFFLLWITNLFGAKVGGWASFTTIVFVFFATIMAFRWGYRPVLWRLRNRLIVTYLFIGVMPILLLLLMGAVAGYLFAGQFATYVAISDLHSELQHLQAANDSLAAQLFPLEASGKLNEHVAGEFTRASDERFPQRTVTVWRGRQGFVLSTSGALLATQPYQIPSFISGDFTGFVVDRGALHLRTIKLHNGGLALVSDIPINPALLAPTADRLGAVTFLPISAGGDNPHNRVDTGQVPLRAHRFDWELRFGTLFDVVDWTSGKKEASAIGVVTRPSMLYATLFATLGDRALIWRDFLLAFAVFFAVIELVALFIGVRLSRSMTAPGGELYRATEHVNQVDPPPRIPLSVHDQMAALGKSFNSMTASLANLIEEQKQKQRMENELSIAYEVQELLFPRQGTDMPSFEVHGVCIPARTVSGDYYDFIPLGSDRIVLAVGDISGKGISAALLMATVHAFVRAYSMEPEMALLPAALGHRTGDEARMYYRGDGSTESQLAPAMLMTTLNYQLYRSTPAAKYATMFLGCD